MNSRRQYKRFAKRKAVAAGIDFAGRRHRGRRRTRGGVDQHPLALLVQRRGGGQAIADRVAGGPRSSADRVTARLEVHRVQEPIPRHAAGGPRYVGRPSDETILDDRLRDQAFAGPKREDAVGVVAVRHADLRYRGRRVGDARTPRAPVAHLVYVIRPAGLGQIAEVTGAEDQIDGAGRVEERDGLRIEDPVAADRHDVVRLVPRRHVDRRIQSAGRDRDPGQKAIGTKRITVRNDALARRVDADRGRRVRRARRRRQVDLRNQIASLNVEGVHRVVGRIEPTGVQHGQAPVRLVGKRELVDVRLATREAPGRERPLLLKGRLRAGVGNVDSEVSPPFFPLITEQDGPVVRADVQLACDEVAGHQVLLHDVVELIDVLNVLRGQPAGAVPEHFTARMRDAVVVAVVVRTVSVRARRGVVVAPVQPDHVSVRLVEDHSGSLSGRRHVSERVEGGSAPRRHVFRPVDDQGRALGQAETVAVREGRVGIRRAVAVAVREVRRDRYSTLDPVTESPARGRSGRCGEYRDRPRRSSGRPARGPAHNRLLRKQPFRRSRIRTAAPS